MSELHTLVNESNLTGQIKPSDGVNSGGAVSKLMGDDTFSVRGGGGGGKGGEDAPRGGAINSPMSKPETYGK